MDFNDIVEKFNNGDLDVTKYFNDYETFFSVLKKRGLMSEVDPSNASDSEEWQNEYFLWLYHNDKTAFDKWVPSLLNDVVFKDGVYYLDTDDRSELNVLFCDGRNDISRSTIENILSGDSDWDPYWDTTDNVYRDVVEELNLENIERLKTYILETLTNWKIEVDDDTPDLFNNYSDDEGVFYLTPKNVGDIINDEESMNYLMDEHYLDELRSELYSVHNQAYNNAYEDTVWEEIWNELSTYFIGHGEWVSRPHRYKKDTEVQHFVIPIANFESNIVGFLEENKGYGNTGTLEYWGSYLGVLKEWAVCLSVRSPDYPDFQKVDKNINELFGEYI
jgi:hypothetical protein